MSCRCALALSRNNRTVTAVPTQVHCKLVTSHTLLNCFACVCRFFHEGKLFHLKTRDQIFSYHHHHHYIRRRKPTVTHNLPQLKKKKLYRYGCQKVGAKRSPDKIQLSPRCTDRVKWSLSTALSNIGRPLAIKGRSRRWMTI